MKAELQNSTGNTETVSRHSARRAPGNWVVWNWKDELAKNQAMR
jgi:hypothetical protein